MRKLVLLLLLVCLLGCVISAPAQTTRSQAREAEWKNYALPQTNFARQINPDKDLIFRVPADWKQVESQLIFNGPHSASITVTTQKVPDGYPLLDYFAAILQAVKDQPGVSEGTVTRKTQLQDLEAREIFLEAPDTEGEIIRSTTWITVSGPLAVVFNLKVPIGHAAEIEPFFKAVVQSVIFLSPDYPAFELLRAAAIKTPVPGPIHEIESIVASLNEVNVDRQSAITRLASLFSSHTDVTIDLLLDRRPLVRTAAVEALAKTNNHALKPILWQLVTDREPLIAEAAARAVAKEPDVVAKTLEHSMFGFKTETIARVWPFMTKEKRNELLEKIFSETAIPRSDPPPPVRKTPAKPGVTVVVGEMVPVKPGQEVKAPPVVHRGISLSTDPNVQLGALTLLISVPWQDYKLPLTRIMASNYDPLIAVALQVAYFRGESLPLDALLKLIVSPNQNVSKFAVQNLGFSATVADIPRIESLISKDATGTKKALDDELRLSVKKIRFRDELNAAKNPAESRTLVTKALSDTSLADFAMRFNCELSIAGCSPAGTQKPLSRDFTIKPFAENLFPKSVQYYTAIPNPGQVVQKFYESLHGLQLDSPRAQSTLTLMMGGIRQMFAEQLSAPADAETLIDYIGIDPNSPLSSAAWNFAGGDNKIRSADRKAIVLRVKDRARFERAIERFHRTSGEFMYFTEGLAIATRLIAALPASIPFAVQAASSLDEPKQVSAPLLRYEFAGENEWNGLRIKTIEHTRITSDWRIEGSSVHMAFIGDTVILTPDLATLRELLSNAGQTDRLADNAEFRKTIESGGDVVYFSDLAALMGEAKATDKNPGIKVNERGALNIAGSSWENTHHFDFTESDWAKPLRPFHPRELSAPRDLLPASTTAYLLMNVDLADVWSSKAKDLVTPTELEKITNLWSLDFKQEVLPELGPECGAVMIELPNLLTASGGSFAFFCKLKSNKLPEALKAGKLFRGVGPVNDVTELKVDDFSFFVTTRNGFIVGANNAKALAAFDGKTNLAATHDYSRAVEKVPAGIVAFGGYNLEAAVAAAGKNSLEGESAEKAKLLFSVATAFHSQNFYATATAGTIEGRSSVAMDREGRYPVADISYLPLGTNITFVTVEPAGIPITDQNRLSSLVLRVRAKAPGPIDNIKDDIKTAEQTVEQKTPTELLVTIPSRRHDAEKSVELPVKDSAFEPYLKATTEFPGDNEEVKKRAREIAGDDRDAWSVARKLADWTHKNLEWKRVVSATATETLATREADCSEFSQLFVALARSLGLPARMVSGLAYSGNSFGGHAWVEVWAGKWIELDPTWGTAFVDATHIRNTSNALVTTAALNLIELEVVEAKRSVSDFQKSSRALTEHLLKAIPTGDRSDIEAAIDLATLTDEFTGAGTWSKMTNGERDQMSSAYRRLLNEIIEGYSSAQRMRLLYLDEEGNTAEAAGLLEPSETMLKLRLVRRNDLWYLVEVLQADSAFYVASETLGPTIAMIEQTRAGQKPPPASLSDFVRVLLLINSRSDKATVAVDKVLKAKPSDKGLLFLKALALRRTEDRKAEGLKLLRALTDQGFGPAAYELASILSLSADENEQKEQVAMYERYASLEPRDPRAFTALGGIYNASEDRVKAEAAYRKALELDSTDIDNYVSLIRFLSANDRIEEAKSVLIAGEKYQSADDDLFGSVIDELYFFEEFKAAEKFAVSEPLRLKKSYLANLTLGRLHSKTGRYADALRALETSAQLEKEFATPHAMMAEVYRKQSRWTAAVKAAQRAVDLDSEYSEAYYQLACALTRLGRIKEALSALTKSVELDEDQVDWMVDEPDLKRLSSLPAFKKLIPEPVKQ